MCPYQSVLEWIPRGRSSLARFVRDRIHQGGRPMQRRIIPGVLLLLSTFLATGSMTDAQSSLPLNAIKLPAGFKIELYASNVPDARSMTLGDQGTLFVGSRQAGKVYAVTGAAGATQVRVIARGL